MLILVKFGEGFENLLDMILFVFEVEELKVNLDCCVIGFVIEVEFDKGCGLVVILLV